MATDLSKAARVRTFLAVECPAAEQQRLASLRPLFAASDAILKWVRPENIHLTLRFLGDVESGKLKAVEEAARCGASSVSAFALRLTTLGAFPDSRQPRVIWVAPEEGPGLDTLHRLQAAVETALDEQGFGRDERAFSPHITLARVREQAARDERRAVGAALAAAQARFRPGDPFPVHRLTIMSSQLRPSGPIYTPMAELPLRGEA